MQEASDRSHQGMYLPALQQEGCVLLPKCNHRRGFRPEGLLDLAEMILWNQSGAPFELEAELLLTFPLLLTFTKLVVLPELADNSHQLLRPLQNNNLQNTTHG
jgi:hypothetical protein